MWWWKRRPRVALALGAVLASITVLGAMSAAGALPIPLPLVGSSGNGLNDLAALGQGLGQSVPRAPTQKNAEPPLQATPLGACGPGSNPEPGIDGRVPSGTGANGLWCNMVEVAHQGTSGGFKVFRYVDTEGHVCAFYDTALLFPTNAINPGGASLGVAVLDMSDPAHPVQTATLTQLPMMTPHESLNLNVARGLLAAVNGNPATEPGLFSIYDVHKDCRHPVLDNTSLVARFGHESGFSLDGKTFYATSTALPSVTAIDVSDPTHPHAIWQGDEVIHGMQLSDDGTRAYAADPTGGDMAILDTSQIQNRVANPQVREISRLTWTSASIPQNAIPFTENGHPYVLEFDEYTQGTINPAGDRDAVGAGRIIDIANEAHPVVVADLRLAIDQEAAHKAAGAAGDPGTQSPAQGYAAHYCNIPTRVNPKLIACSFIASGLRVFDISDLLHPKEVGYFVAPTTPNTETGYNGSDYAMSMPAFDTARHEIWYSDGGTGFYVVQLVNGKWPGSAVTPLPGANKGCPTATGRLSGRKLGPVALGMSRTAARRAYTRSSSHRRVNMDYFCLTPIGVRIGYGLGKVARRFSAAQQHQFGGKVVLMLTSNTFYSLRGVLPGMKLATARRRVKLSRGIRIGANTWYLFAANASRGVLKVRHGVVQEVGLAPKALTARPKQAFRFLDGFPPSA